MKNFEEILSRFGRYRCTTMKRNNKGMQIKCLPGQHSCLFLLHKPTEYETHKLPPRYPTYEQRRMFNYSSEDGEGYFKKYKVNKQRRAPK